jgi:uncharacterized protein YegP (UPF0339 family)
METNAESVEILQGDDEQWYWHAKGGNGEIVAQSEGYTEKGSAERAAEDTFPGIPIAVTTVINEPTDEEPTDASS